MFKKLVYLFCFSLLLSTQSWAQHDENQEGEATEEAHGAEAGHGEHAAFDPARTIIHHISDGNVMTILDWITIPLPSILYSKDKGLDVFMSNKFESGHHEDGHYGYNGYVLHMGSIYRVLDSQFPQTGKVTVDGFINHEETNEKGKVIEIPHVIYEGQEFRLTPKSTLDGGLVGGGLTEFFDFSISKNVLAMIVVSLLFFWMFTKAAKAYKTHPDRAPKGIQGFLEPMFLFIRDEVAIPFIGKYKYKKYLPLLMSIFFFVLGLNLFGQVPFLGSVNVTGNLTVTMVLAVLVFLVVNLSGNRHYWQHIFWMPGVPAFVKPLLAVVEIMSIFVKPLTLMLRLAGNITAGHIAILSFIGLIFIFGNSGESLVGGSVGTAMAIPLTMFMMAIELIVAFVQAFVFTILTASYIGAATVEHHHEEGHH